MACMEGWLTDAFEWAWAHYVCNVYHAPLICPANAGIEVRENRPVPDALGLI